MAAEEHRFPCDTCGADMRFDPGARAMVCPYCGNTQPVDGSDFVAQPLGEQDYRAAVEASLPDHEIEELRVSSCPNCGALVEFRPDIHATECPFCATPVVTDTGTRRRIKPRGVVPFVLSEDAGRDAMTKWLGGLWFAPNGLQDYARKGRKLDGIYVPYWTFDADTKSRYRGERGTVYYEAKMVHHNGKFQSQRAAKTRWRNVSGRVVRWFDDVLVLASASLPERFTDALLPWDLTALQPYLPQYLAGFRAEAYTVEIIDGYQQARAAIDRQIQRDVRGDIGGDTQRIHEVQTRVSKVTFKHVLLPVWLAAYKYRGKSYRFVINGQSGRVEGERPWSAVKILLAVLAVLAVALIAGAVGYLSAQG